jgi:hypothetical protein
MSNHRPKCRSDRGSETRSRTLCSEQRQTIGDSLTSSTGCRRANLRHSSDRGASTDRHPCRVSLEGVLCEGIPVTIGDPDGAVTGDT